MVLCQSGNPCTNRKGGLGTNIDQALSECIGWPTWFMIMQLQVNCHNKEDNTVRPYLGQRYGTGLYGNPAPKKDESKRLPLFLATTYVSTTLEE